MPGTIFGYPFDEELFLQMWTEVPDTRKDAMIQSGALVNDGYIRQLIANDGNFYTIPFYNLLNAVPFNYDGQTDITVTETTGTHQSGVVWGRAQAFGQRDFTAELSGSDPIGHITQKYAKYWMNEKQKILLQILAGIFATTDTSANATQFKATHTLDTGAPVSITDGNRLMTMSLGDNKDQYSLAIMHSLVAERLENLQVLEFWTNTLANGLQMRSRIANWDGLIAIIDDGVPFDTGTGKATTYLFSNGALRTAPGRVDHPVAVERDELLHGGTEHIVTRVRETYHPNGFSYKIPGTGWTQSPTDAQLASGDNWSVVFDPKAIGIAQLITTEVPVTP